MTGLVPATTSWVELAPAAKSLATDIYKTEFVPQALRGNAPAVLACVMAGAEIGLGPMTSLQLIDVIQGRPALSPEGQRALVLRAGHRLAPREMTDRSCTVWGQRADTGDELSVTWTIEQAQRAGLAGKGAWRTYPEAMLLARATSALCRALFADVISGIGSYTPDELGHPIDGDVAAVASPPASAAVVDEWETATPAGAASDGDGPVEAELVEDIPPYRDGPPKVADPDARIARSSAQRLVKRLEQLPEHLQERARMVWVENKWPTKADGTLRPTLLTEQQLHTMVEFLEVWEAGLASEPDTPDTPDAPDREAVTDDEWAPSATEEAEQVLAAGGLTGQEAGS